MTNVTKLGFPAGFTWGAATAAYQIEGATDVDGRGPSVWDTFSHTPGKVRGGDTGDIACDSYRRYPEDADLLRSLGLTDYRFSISWPRIIPDGAGQVNQAGLGLLQAAARRARRARDHPGGHAVPLGHCRRRCRIAGGWASRDTALRLADYAAVVGEALGDRVKRWITLNEPLVVAHNGHRIGVHAPGLRDDAAAAATTHHLLLGHGLAAAALRASVPGVRSGHHAEPDPDPRYQRRQRLGRGPGEGPPGRGRQPERDVPRPDPVRPVPGARAGVAAAARRADRGRRPGDDRRADRLPRRELLPAGAPAGGRPGQPAPGREVAAGGDLRATSSSSTPTASSRPTWAG